MMAKTLKLKGWLIFAPLVCSGCVTVDSAMGGATNTDGDAWYTETTTVVGIPVSARVYHCPAPIERKRLACQEARMVPLTEDSATLVDTGSSGHGQNKPQQTPTIAPRRAPNDPFERSRPATGAPTLDPFAPPPPPPPPPTPLLR